MKKILIKNAILQESLFMINNNYTADFNQEVDSVKGRLRITGFEKFKLYRENVERRISEENFDNLIGKLDLEYTNLNTYENFDTITSEFYLSDLDNFRFKTIGDIDILIAISESREEDYDEKYKIDNFIPKIKKKITLFYLLPDEETDYYFELDEGDIVEI